MENRWQFNEILEKIYRNSQSNRYHIHNTGGSNNSDDRHKVVGEELGRRDKWRNIKISLFSGEDAYGWVSKIKRYFDLKSLGYRKTPRRHGCDGGRGFVMVQMVGDVRPESHMGGFPIRCDKEV